MLNALDFPDLNVLRIAVEEKNLLCSDIGATHLQVLKGLSAQALFPRIAAYLPFSAAHIFITLPINSCASPADSDAFLHSFFLRFEDGAESYSIQTSSDRLPIDSWRFLAPLDRLCLRECRNMSLDDFVNQMRKLWTFSCRPRLRSIRFELGGADHFAQSMCPVGPGDLWCYGGSVVCAA